MNTIQSLLFIWKTLHLSSFAAKDKHLKRGLADSLHQDLISWDKPPACSETNIEANVESSSFKDALKKDPISSFTALPASEQTEVTDRLEQLRSRFLEIKGGEVGPHL